MKSGWPHLEKRQHYTRFLFRFGPSLAQGRALMYRLVIFEIGGFSTSLACFTRGTGESGPFSSRIPTSHFARGIQRRLPFF